jgi:hypothetical protein
MTGLDSPQFGSFSLVSFLTGDDLLSEDAPDIVPPYKSDRKCKCQLFFFLFLSSFVVHMLIVVTHDRRSKRTSTC